MANQDQRERDRDRNTELPREDAISRREPSRMRRRDEFDPWSDPFRTMRRMFDQFERLAWLSGFGPSSRLGGRSAILAGWTPQIDTFQRGDDFVVRADLPGLEKKDVIVEMQDGMLVIQGERSSERETQDDAYFTSERTYGQFSRVIPLPEGADPESVKATFKNGVLEVTMRAPQTQESRGRKIEISDAGR